MSMRISSGSPLKMAWTRGGWEGRETHRRTSAEAKGSKLFHHGGGGRELLKCYLYFICMCSHIPERDKVRVNTFVSLLYDQELFSRFIKSLCFKMLLFYIAWQWKKKTWYVIFKQFAYLSPSKTQPSCFMNYSSKPETYHHEGGDYRFFSSTRQHLLGLQRERQ